MRLLKNLKFIRLYDLDNCFHAHAEEIRNLNNDVHSLKSEIYELKEQITRLATATRELTKYIKTKK